jgi:hypothetical protein
MFTNRNIDGLKLVFFVNKPINNFIIDRYITDDSFFDGGILFISLSVKFIQKD